MKCLKGFEPEKTSQLGPAWNFFFFKIAILRIMQEKSGMWEHCSKQFACRKKGEGWRSALRWSKLAVWPSCSHQKLSSWNLRSFRRSRRNSRSWTRKVLARRAGATKLFLIPPATWSHAIKVVSGGNIFFVQTLLVVSKLSILSCSLLDFDWLT